MRNRSSIIWVLGPVVAGLLATPAFAKPPVKEDKSKARIKHIVVVMMENRSFDHLLGWHPTANAMNTELSYPDRDDPTVEHPTTPLAPDFQGCGHPDPDHSWEGGRVDVNDGAMDGFLRAGSNDQFAIGYYEHNDRPFFNALALNFTTCDNFFSAILAETYPNRVFMHAAQTDRLTNTLDLATIPTIWDRLADKGVSARYYFSDVSFLALWGPKYFDIHRPYSDFLDDAAAGTLPAVSFVEPRFLGEEEGTSGDDHPHADIRAGDAFLAQTFHAVSSGPGWPGTVFIITYDEWGGFFDHVAPPRAAAANDVDPDIVDGKTLLGLRIPVVVASPFTRGNPSSPRVNSTRFDNTSILKFIEWRWNLAPLTPRDALSDIGSLQSVLTTNYIPAVPALPNPLPPPPNECPDTATAQSQSESDEVGMEDLALLPTP